ncbi:MAG: hypothetical protein A3F84_23065 [Candidatus Handelsmanbacteria bacterium RIFCSPLOWO2_12_FULL_64_10]|uniref:Methyltransferase type 11 domain-containing protein n=1 Tax=Handelsmanbacteria sp. (strain RIFCSPLOWO2_12_FULL_64_10) TaxID=1817868 RepID=A0A1F6CG44_HANXR|nr:MAG: hypothetical protein A3F84_23065 [Candidatus Handelsmanbacteria bacterium RIFCSPLOWO2_12_FULL_64_10]
MQTDFFKCLFCGAPAVRPSNTRWICSECQHCYPIEQEIPLLVRDWQRHSEGLDKARSAKPDWYLTEQPAAEESSWRHHVQKRRHYVEAAIQRYLQTRGQVRADSLLDLGCGDGNHVAYLSNYADALFASDYNLVRLIRTRARLLQVDATFFLADILDYPARDNFFEIIFFNHVLEHIPDDIAALRAIFRLLQPRGLLILGTPNEGAWWWQLAYRLEPETRQNTDHVHFYTASSLTEKLTRVGFKVYEVKYLGWGPPYWRLDARIRRYKLVDDWLECVGRRLIKSQASSLYLLATKE